MICSLAFTASTAFMSTAMHCPSMLQQESAASMIPGTARFMQHGTSARATQRPSIEKAMRAEPPKMGASGSESSGEYDYDGWRLAYRHKPAAAGHEDEAPLLLIHPIGIGMSSWFWEPFMESWEGAEVFAPDLIGCGNSEPWKPDQRGLFVPLDWARGCEALWRQKVQRPCVVMAQGGLAPVGIQLAARMSDDWDGHRAVEALVLTSPPRWSELCASLPSNSLLRNYHALSSPLGDASLGLLEKRPFVEFFSNQFLFKTRADERWLTEACSHVGPSVRPPVVAFNAGLANARSFEEELRELTQPTLVLSGDGDRRAEERKPFQSEMASCTLKTLPGLNVLPWESPADTCSAVRAFLRLDLAHMCAGHHGAYHHESHM